ncbi:hypothetical protein TTHERM_00112370 (macronuclear) [Tetrahymena thermophila SB210]|uniref:Uncharacterized protein n=1 Tax=Tetrahymena thermophila (strain SB210) TaxID=312017 RepID=Q22ZD4_TETTS|nr:hypothetical protein TTHERM_00112370 [Tetrahymena thermophila SB210]EAR90387.2 hypothetical protein TTHERM_00112370 [Tetrahymena thermophila SB210]|eukprot:XP_001010632.2 hypothetical protein TTHERM_00112370 [Tetrahymena thermophila SB210]
MQTGQQPNIISQNVAMNDRSRCQDTFRSPSLKSICMSSSIQDDLKEDQMTNFYTEMAFKRESMDDMTNLSIERETKQETLSETFIGSHNNMTKEDQYSQDSVSKNKKDKLKQKNTNNNNNIPKQSKLFKSKSCNQKKNKREIRCKSALIQQDKKTNAHRLDFDFLVFDSLKYAEKKSPLQMAYYHKSMDKFEMNKKDKLLTIHFDSLDKIKTPITLILKKLISDSSSSAKDLCDSLYYFHKLLKKFRTIRENNNDKINIFKQFMPLLPNHQTPEQVLASDPKFPSLTATYKINAKKGTISLDKYTFNEKLSQLLGFPKLELLQQHIQFTKKLPSLTVPTDYYNYIMEALLNKFEKQRSSVCKGVIKTFDGILLNITEKMVSRCHIDSDITPAQLNLPSQTQQTKEVNLYEKCKIEVEDFDYPNKQTEDDDDEEDNEDENTPQGILYVMTKHFFFIENQEINKYIFSKERLALCESIDFSKLIQESLPLPQEKNFDYVYSKSKNCNSKNNKVNKLNGENPSKKIFLNNQREITKSVQDAQQILKEEFIPPASSSINNIQPSTPVDEIKNTLISDNDCNNKQVDYFNLKGIDLLELIKQTFQIQNEQKPIQNKQTENNINNHESQSNEQINLQKDIVETRCSYRLVTSNKFES